MNYYRLTARVSSVLALVALLLGCSTSEHVELRLIHTTDVHGNLLPYDHINQSAESGSMARLASMLSEFRSETPDLILLDGGDMLQGDPITYYSNYVDTVRTNAVVVAMNALGYDAATIGNHDIEPGAQVYDRFVREVSFPVLGANVTNTETGKPYFTPYTIIERSGVRVAVLGLVTPAIPQWLPEHLWRGMHFEDIVESAPRWIEHIQREEHPDLLVAMIHSGLDNDNADYLENAGRKLAISVSGIDLILTGHDHRRYAEWIHRDGGDSVLVINPANHLDVVSDVRIMLERRDGRVVSKRIEADFRDVNTYTPDTSFLARMAGYEEGLSQFLGKRVGMLDAPVKAHNALFGSSSYMDVMHRMQMATVGAEISFAAPLALSTELSSGDVFVRDLFKWCPFSNYLYVMELTGREVLGYLEHSYAGWAGTMASREDRLIAMRPDAKETDRYKTQVPTFNYSSAQGIDYTVDVSKPVGSRVMISQMSSGEPFDLDRTYRCAINSYRAGGAGGMLTTGAGIEPSALKGRIVGSSSHDQLYSLMRYFEIKGIVEARDPRNWRFVPTAWASEAIPRDSLFLFGR